jgi:hypothetical protein
MVVYSYIKIIYKIYIFKVDCHHQMFSIRIMLYNLEDVHIINKIYQHSEIYEDIVNIVVNTNNFV